MYLQFFKQFFLLLHLIASLHIKEKHITIKSLDLYYFCEWGEPEFEKFMFYKKFLSSWDIWQKQRPILSGGTQVLPGSHRCSSIEHNRPTQKSLNNMNGSQKIINSITCSRVSKKRIVGTQQIFQALKHGIKFVGFSLDVF